MASSRSARFRNWLRRLDRTPIRDLLRGRVTGRLDFARRYEEELGEALSDRIYKIVNGASLFMSEKPLAADELAEQCRSALAQGKSSESIIESLPRRKTIKLLKKRLAKRRSRIVRLLLKLPGTAIISILGIYLFGLLVLWVLKPVPSVDYLALISKPSLAVPEADRGWPIYREAIALLDVHGDMAGEVTYRGNSPDGPAWDESRVYLESHQPGFAKLRDAAAMPGLGLPARYPWEWEDEDAFALFGPDQDDPTRPDTWGPPEGIKAEMPRLLNDVLPPFRQCRRLARLLVADGFYAAEQGDADRFCDTVDALLGLSGHASEVDHDWGYLHSTSIKAIALGLLTDVLVYDSSFLSDEHLERIADSIRRDAGHTHPVPLTQFHEINDFIQHTYTGSGPGGGLISTEGVFRMQAMTHFNDQPFHEKTARVSSVFLAPFVAMIFAPRRSLEVLLEDCMQAASDEWTIPMWEQPHSRADELAQGKDWSTFQRIRYFPFPIYSGSFNALRKVSARNRACRQGVQAGIALEQYRRDNGAWPDRLETLTPLYLDAVPIDPITGGEAMYLVQNGKPVVYSVGRDRDNDRGRLPISKHDDEPSVREAESWGEPEDYDGDWVLFPYPDTPRASGRDLVKREAERAELEAKLRERGVWHGDDPYGWPYYPPEDMDPDQAEDDPQGVSGTP